MFFPIPDNSLIVINTPVADPDNTMLVDVIQDATEMFEGFIDSSSSPRTEWEIAPGWLHPDNLCCYGRFESNDPYGEIRSKDELTKVRNYGGRGRFQLSWQDRKRILCANKQDRKNPVYVNLCAAQMLVNYICDIPLPIVNNYFPSNNTWDVGILESGVSFAYHDY
jgi:hypothetical protein